MIQNFKNNGNNFDIKLTEIKILKDIQTGNLKAINRFSNEEIENIGVKIDPLNNNNYFLYDKENCKIIKNIVKKIDPETGDETFVKYDMYVKKENDLMIINDPISCNEVLINKDTGKKINHLIHFKNKKNGEILLIDKETGEKINFITEKDKKSNNIIIKINQNLQDNEKVFLKKEEIEILKDPQNGKFIPINKE